MTLLAFQAWERLHAVILTLVRVFITQRRLLEWETAAVASARAAGLMDERGVRLFVAEMAASPITGVLALAIAVLLRPAAVPWALPFVAAVVGGAVRRLRLSRPVEEDKVELSEADRALFADAARRTWSYFTTYVTADDHWLPPDNFQEDPGGIVGHRTSPTNIGLGLLANLAAHDLGLIDLATRDRPAGAHAGRGRGARALGGPPAQLVRHHDAGAALRRATCRPSTAATWSRPRW